MEVKLSVQGRPEGAQEFGSSWSESVRCSSKPSMFFSAPLCGDMLQTHIWTHTYIHTHMDVCTCTYTMCTHICRHMHTHSSHSTCTCAHTCRCVHTPIYMHVRTHPSRELLLASHLCTGCRLCSDPALTCPPPAHLDNQVGPFMAFLHVLAIALSRGIISLSVALFVYSYLTLPES